MDVRILASSSSGNSYRVSDGQTSLLLECGIPIQKIKERLGFRLSSIDGCLVSHEHKDHCKAVEDIVKAGIDVYLSTGTKEAIGVDGHRIKAVKARQQFGIGTLTILPFETEHDAKEPLGYLIYSNVTKDKLLFATDTYYIRYKFKDLTHIMVECNYASDILQSNIQEGLIPESLRKRLLESHFSLANVKNFLLANDLSKVQEIYLMHLSSGNSDAERFKREIQEVTGKQIIIC